MHTINRRNLALGAILFVFPAGGHADACEVVALPQSVDLVRQANLIVIARALSYTTPPAAEQYGTNGEPETRIRFQVLGVLKGSSPVASELVLPGFLVNVDDFNDEPPPYSYVRPFGRKGNCFADVYRQGGSFLLLLKALGDSGYTARWSPMAPLNEQLHAVDDPWVVWIRDMLK